MDVFEFGTLFAKGAQAEALRQIVRDKVVVIDFKQPELSTFSNYLQVAMPGGVVGSQHSAGVIIVHVQSVHFPKKEVKFGKVYWSSHPALPSCTSDVKRECTAHKKHVIKGIFKSSTVQIIDEKDIDKHVVLHGL